MNAKDLLWYEFFFAELHEGLTLTHSVWSPAESKKKHETNTMKQHNDRIICKLIDINDDVHVQITLKVLFVDF